MIKNKAVINEESSNTISLLKKELMAVKRDLAQETQLRQNLEDELQKFGNMMGEDGQVISQFICKVCKK